MSQPLLSILIPTTIDRSYEYWRLIDRLKSIYPNIGIDGIVEEVTDHAGKEITIGEKREGLYKYARGVYSWQIDDDDDIADNAIELILDVIRGPRPDCITFREHCMINGVHYKSNHSLQYEDWEGDGQREFADGFHFHRTPFMKSVIRTDIARSVPVPYVRWSEDHQWSQALKPHLKTEVHIPADIYYYQHVSSDPTERYGLNK